jgi:hypothetical protein
MIEIFVLYRLCTSLGARPRAKAQPTIPYQILLVVGWFIAEFVGGVVGFIVSALATGNTEGVGILPYVFALAFAAGSALLIFLIARVLPNKAVPAPAFPVEPVATSSAPL